MKNLNKIGLAAVMAIVLAGFGCGRSISEKAAERAIEKEIGGNADVNYNADGSATIKTEEGTVSTENKVPADWPNDVPVYAGATIAISGSNFKDDESSGLILSSQDSVDAIFNFYKSELAKQGWTITIATQSIYGTAVQATKDDRTVGVGIQSLNPGTQIVLSISKE